MNHARHRYNELLEEYFELLPPVSIDSVIRQNPELKPSAIWSQYEAVRNYRSQRLQELSWRIPLTDATASYMELKELHSRLFVRVRRSHLIAQEHELRRVG